MEQAESRSHISTRRAPVWLALLLVAAALVLYFPVAHHSFLNGWDDSDYVTENPHAQSGITLASLKWAFVTQEPFYWHPLTRISHLVDCELFGVNAGAHHLVSVALHAANAILLFILLNHATRALWCSFLVAALFALHPTNVETVAWVAERKTLLVTFFSLLTIAAYGWYAKAPSWRRYLLVISGFVLALLCKPIAIIIPMVLLLIDYWPLERLKELPLAGRWSKLVTEKLPLILMAAGFVVFTFAAGTRNQSVVSYSVLPLSTRLENAALAYAAYVGNLLVPIKLSPFYSHPAMMLGPSLPAGQVAASALIVAIITAAVFFVPDACYARMGWLFFLGTLVPVIGLVQTGYAGRADHFTYISSIGLFICLVWGLAAVFENTPLPAAAPLVIAVAIVAAYGVAAERYLHHWKDEVALFGHARATAGQPDPWLEQLYATALLQAGRQEEALKHFRLSCSIGPLNELCHYYIGRILFDRRDFPGALEQLQIALDLTTNRQVRVMELDMAAQTLLEMRQYAAAEAMLSDALQIDPGDSTAQELKGKISSRSGF